MVLSPLTITRTSLLPAARCAVLVLTPAAAPRSAQAPAQISISLTAARIIVAGFLRSLGDPRHLPPALQVQPGLQVSARNLRVRRLTSSGLRQGPQFPIRLHLFPRRVPRD